MSAIDTQLKKLERVVNVKKTKQPETWREFIEMTEPPEGWREFIEGIEGAQEVY